MASKQSTENKKGNSKETVFKEIALKLTQAISSLKESLGEKKFEKRIKKASKLLGEGIKPNGQEKAPSAKMPAGKTTVKKTKAPTPGKKAAKAAGTK